MSAIFVLVLRVLLVVFLYGFLGWAFSVLWREMRLSGAHQASLSCPAITIKIDGELSMEFEQPEITFGRGPHHDIQISEEVVSENHARIYFLNGNWMLEDSHSTNGTFLNGERIHSPTVLVDEDTFNIGGKTFTFLLGKNTASS